MNRSVIFTILCCICAVLPIAAQTAAPEGMVLIPSGKFWMGRAHAFWRDPLDTVARAKRDDRPANHVYLDDFYFDKFEVTNADYTRFVEATSTKPPWHWPKGKFTQGEERQAVYNVNWFEATEFCKWAGKRLPTEAEWEKAARGGLDRNLFPWGNEQGNNGRLPAVVNRGKAAAVGSFPANGYGVHDVVGNVMEWTNDWYDLNYYAFMPKHNPKGPDTGLYKSVRGGGWSDRETERLMIFYRNFSDPELRGSTIGFRCAK